ncbi:zinc finger, C3HC4 type [Trichuris suis]|nr:zinc finger, C3HC4 type [Trichuris suis]
MFYKEPQSHRTRNAPPEATFEEYFHALVKPERQTVCSKQKLMSALKSAKKIFKNYFPHPQSTDNSWVKATVPIIFTKDEPCFNHLNLSSEANYLHYEWKLFNDSAIHTVTGYAFDICAMLFVCIICRDSCTLEEISLLPCGHGFHRGCLTNAIRRKKSCPKCHYRFRCKSVVEKIYLEVEKSAEKNKKSSKSEQTELINALLENREEYQLKIAERTRKLRAIEEKIREVNGLLKSTREAVKGLAELESEESVLQSAVAGAKTENWRLRRLLQLSEDEEIMCDLCGGNGKKEILLCSLSMLLKQYAKLKKKHTDIVKQRLLCTSRIALAKRESSLLRESANKSASGKSMYAIDEQPKWSKPVVVDLICALLENRGQYRSKIGKGTEKLRVIEKKAREVPRLSESTVKAAKSLAELESGRTALTREVADVNMEDG